MVFVSKLNSRLPRYVWVVPSLAWMILIFLLSSRESVSVSEKYWTNFLVFKSLHVIEYAVLTLLNTLAIVKNNTHITFRKAVLVAALLALAYAASDEMHQLYVPTRTGNIRDVLVDSIGIFSVYWLITHYEKSKERPPISLRSRTP